MTIKAAAGALGIKDYALRRAIKAGLVPSYRAFSSRWMVRLSDLEAAIQAHRNEPR